MAVTPNYSWPVPDDTDLVKDGAEAIRDLGNAIDTTVDSLPSGGLVHIVTTSFSAVASQSINDVFSATYSNYKILITGVSSTDVDMQMRLRVGGADNSTASSYVTQYVNANNTTISGLRQTDDIAFIGIFGSAQRSSLDFNVYFPFTTTPTNFSCYSASGESGAFLRISSGTHNQSVSYTGFTFKPQSGTITGSVSVFGYNV